MLEQYQILRISGADALSFLQGQLTCDIQKIDSGGHTLGAHCNAQGRMHYSFRIAKLESNEYAMRIHESVVDHALSILKKYAVFSKVEIEICDKLKIFALQLPGRGEKNFLESIMAHTSLCFELKNTIDNNQNAEVLEIWSRDSLPEDLQNLEELSNEMWSINHIKAGIAEITSLTSEIFTPQDCNFQYIDAISFKKGCYTGQEVIARLHYKAKLKKHMYLAKTNKLLNFAPGQFIQNSLGEKIGEAVNSTTDKNEKISWILILAKDAVVHFDKIIPLQNDATLSWCRLPYNYN